jgi:hypothetical protein
MTRFENTEDAVEYVVGGSLFFVVSALTAAVMAIGFGVITAIDSLRHRS